MSEEEFTKLTLLDKWNHVSAIMEYIGTMDKLSSLQDRYHTNHSDKENKQRRRLLRADQYQRWIHVKNLYAGHRDEMANTLENDKFIECRNILEQIFTSELDDALRNVIDD